MQTIGGKKLAFARRQILQQSSALIVHLCFSSTLSFCTFLKKYQKQGSRVRHSVLKVDNIAFSHPVRCKLCLHCARLYAVNVVDLQSKFKSRFATSFSRCTPRCSLLVAMLGAARTRFAQTACRLFPIIARPLTVPPNAELLMLAAKAQTSLAFARLHVTFRRWRGIAFAMAHFANFARTMVMFK